jgi:hypothetical protein
MPKRPKIHRLLIAVLPLVPFDGVETSLAEALPSARGLLSKLLHSPEEIVEAVSKMGTEVKVIALRGSLKSKFREVEGKFQTLG